MMAALNVMNQPATMHCDCNCVADIFKPTMYLLKFSYCASKHLHNCKDLCKLEREKISKVQPH